MRVTLKKDALAPRWKSTRPEKPGQCLPTKKSFEILQNKMKGVDATCSIAEANRFQTAETVHTGSGGNVRNEWTFVRVTYVGRKGTLHFKGARPSDF